MRVVIISVVWNNIYMHLPCAKRYANHITAIILLKPYNPYT